LGDRKCSILKIIKKNPRYYLLEIFQMLVLFYYTSPNPLQHELGRTIAGDILKDIEELFYCSVVFVEILVKLLFSQVID
jgi:hypothetical protein